MAQPLPRGVDEEQDRAAGVVAHRRDHAGRHGERDLDARLGVVRRADDLERGAAVAAGTRQQAAVDGHRVAVGEQPVDHVAPAHRVAPGYAARRARTAATSTSVGSIGMSCGDSMPMARQMSSPSRQPP